MNVPNLVRPAIIIRILASDDPGTPPALSSSCVLGVALPDNSSKNC